MKWLYSSTLASLVGTLVYISFLICIQVVQYNLEPHQRDLHVLDWVDTSLTAEVNRVNISLQPLFLGSVLEFVKSLEIDQSSYANAAKATAETATVTVRVF